MSPPHIPAQCNDPSSEALSTAIISGSMVGMSLCASVMEYLRGSGGQR